MRITPKQVVEKCSEIRPEEFKEDLLDSIKETLEKAFPGTKVFLDYDISVTRVRIYLVDKNIMLVIIIPVEYCLEYFCLNTDNYDFEYKIHLNT